MGRYLKAIRGGGVRGLHGERLRLLRTRPFRDAIVASLVVLLLWTPFIIWNLWYTSNTQVQAFNDRLQLFGTAISTSMAESATLLQRLLQWRLDGVDKDWQSPAAVGLFSDWRSYCSGSLGAFAVEGSEPRLLSVSAAVAAVPIIEQAVADRFPELLQRMRDKYDWQRITHILPTGDEGTLKGLYKNYAGKIYAKTGTLSNHVALSGYLLTGKGKTLIFSVLVNAHQTSAAEIRKQIETFLTGIIDRY